MKTSGLVGLLALAVAGCGGSTSEDAAGGGAGGSVSTGGATSSGGSAGSAGTGGGSTTSACDATAESLAQSYAAGASCTTVLRLSDAFAIKDYAVVCGNYASPDEATAKATADKVPGFTACAPPGSSSGASPDDAFLFFHPAMPYCASVCCGDGWVQAVGAQNGLVVFAGTIPTSAEPGVKVPAALQPAEALGLDCSSQWTPPTARGFDFTDMNATDSAALDSSTVEKALAALTHSALPSALAKKHYVFNALVLAMPTSYEPAASTEYVVLLSSGWLE